MAPKRTTRSTQVLPVTPAPTATTTTVTEAQLQALIDRGVAAAMAKAEVCVITHIPSGSTTTHADYSLPKYDSFLFKIEPDQDELTSVVILAEPRVYMPNVLTTHPTLMLDSDFIPSDNSLPESKIFYFNIKEKNSGSTTIHTDISLPGLECFNFKREPK
nr:hypothetical protein [Tanacetum cinerariifolium]